MELFIVHEGVWGNHYTSETLFPYLDSLRPGQVVNDRAAQTIASWWHSPGQPLSTVLSTMGKVDRRMTRDDFCDATEYAELIRRGAAADPLDSADARNDRRAVDALCAYITAKIATAESSYRPCACRDCFETAIGIIGALCNECEPAGCTFGEGYDCQRYDAYGAEDDPCPEQCGECIYCIPGA
jgi:hypothetical protein